MIEIECRHCGHRIRLADPVVGESVYCKECNSPFVVSSFSIPGESKTPCSKSQHSQANHPWPRYLAVLAGGAGIVAEFILLASDDFMLEARAVHLARFGILVGMIAIGTSAMQRRSHLRFAIAATILNGILLLVFFSNQVGRSNFSKSKLMIQDSMRAKIFMQEEERAALEREIGGYTAELSKLKTVEWREIDELPNGSQTRIMIALRSPSTKQIKSLTGRLHLAYDGASIFDKTIEHSPENPFTDVDFHILTIDDSEPNLLILATGDRQRFTVKFTPLRVIFADGTEQTFGE